MAQRVIQYQKRINEQVKGIKEGMEKGDYFPHYLMETMVRIEKEMDTVYEKNNLTLKDANEHLGTLQDVLAKMRDEIHRTTFSI